MNTLSRLALHPRYPMVRGGVLLALVLLVAGYAYMARGCTTASVERSTQNEEWGDEVPAGWHAPMAAPGHPHTRKTTTNRITFWSLNGQPIGELLADAANNPLVRVVGTLAGGTGVGGIVFGTLVGWLGKRAKKREDAAFDEAHNRALALFARPEPPVLNADPRVGNGH